MLKLFAKLLFLKTIIKNFWWVPLVYVVLLKVLPWEREVGHSFD
jgi:hypothetical protein